jgi:pre-mRNA-processing factor 40
MCRYSALKTLGERKAAFNEYVQLRKKEEANALKEKARQAREDFIAMLEESTELKAATRYSAAGKLFEDDMRWHVCSHFICLKAFWFVVFAYGMSTV